MKSENYISKKSKIAPRVELEAPIRMYGDVVIKNDVEIGYFSYIHTRSTVHAGTTIGRFCSIGKNVELSPFDHPIDWLSSSPVSYNAHLHFPEHQELFKKSKIDRKQPAKIGNDVWIASNSIVLRGVTIGDGAIVGAGSIVTKDVEPYSIVAGSPARMLGKRFDDRTIERLLATQWWNQPREALKDLSFDDLLACLNTLEDRMANTPQETDSIDATKAQEIATIRKDIQSIENGDTKPISSEKEAFAVVLGQKLQALNASDDTLTFVEKNAAKFWHRYDPVDPHDQMALNNKMMEIVSLTQNVDQTAELPRSIQKSIMNLMANKQ